jgi:hypothetical protein
MSSSSETATEQVCRGCDKQLPLTGFNVHASMANGHRSECRDCQSIHSQIYYQKKHEDKERAVADWEEHGEEPDPPAKRSKFFEAAVAGSDLYVFAISTDPLGVLHGLKVGRSGNIQQRGAALSESMPFNIQVLATFPGAGHLEKAVHTQLETTRNTAGRGREWFHTTLPNITHAVACAMQSAA